MDELGEFPGAPEALEDRLGALEAVGLVQAGPVGI